MGTRPEEVEWVAVPLVNVSLQRGRKRNSSELRYKTQQNPHLKRELMKHSVWSKLLPYGSNEETETEQLLCEADTQYLWRGACPALLAAVLVWESCTRH